MDDRFEDLREDSREDESREQERQEQGLSIADYLRDALQEIKESRENPTDQKGKDEDKLEKDKEKLERTPSDKTEELSRVLYQRNGQIYLPDERAETSSRVVLAAAVALREETGGKLVMTQEAIDAARHTSAETLRESLQTVIKTYQEERGAQYNINESPMFKNFPDSVYSMDKFELEASRIIGYYADAVDMAFDLKGEARSSLQLDGPRQEREPLKDTIKADELRPGKDSDYNQYIRDLIGSKASLSDGEREIVSGAFKYQDVRDIMPEKIEQKDNLAFIARLSIEREIPVDRLPLKNATDAMRVGRELNKYEQREEKERDSKGREKNTDNGYYKFGNREKKFIYQILERDKNILTNMKGREDEFKALARGLNGYRGAEEKFPHAYAALQRVSNNEKLPVTADGRFNDLRDRGEVLRAADMRKEFPGKFTKELDSLLTQSMTRSTAMGVVDRYSEVVDRVPVRSLFIAKSHFEQREEGLQTRTCMPKDDPRRPHAYEKDVRPIDSEAKERLVQVIDRGLQEQLREREPMGRCYVDPAYKLIPIPKDTRTESDSGRSMTRGTSREIPKDKEVVRAFYYSQDSRPAFFDLSAVLLDKDFRPIDDGREAAAWHTSFRPPLEWGAHSGDSFNNSAGFSQFVDLKLDKLEELRETHNAGYVAIELNSWNGIPFKDMGASFFGFMEREHASSGEAYDPRTVEYAQDIRSNAIAMNAMVLDIENRTMTMVDMDMRKDSGRREDTGNSDTRNTLNDLRTTTMAAVSKEGPTMYDVLTANIAARGELVDNPRDADVVFGIDRDSQATREHYGMDREVEVEVEKEDGSKGTEMQPAHYEYHDMFERASWGKYL